MKKQRFVICSLVVFLLLGCSMQENKEASYQKRIEKANAALKKDTCYLYHYKRLSKADKKVYALIYHGLKKQDQIILTQEEKTKKVDTILQAVVDDHPELYDYSTGYASMTSDDKVKVVVAYNDNREIRKERNEQLQATLREVKTQVNDTMSDFDKVKLVYDFVIMRNEYVDNAKNNQNIISALVDKQTVCAGYAKAVQYLLNHLGVEATYITGEILQPEEGEIAAHAWNLVKIDNQYYYLDPTWGDFVSEESNHTCYSYFMMSKQEVERLYKCDIEWEETGGIDNYFTRTQTYVNGYDEGQLINAFANSYNQQKGLIEVKMSEENYAWIKTKLLGDESRVFAILEGIGIYDDNIEYRENDEMNTIEIYL